MERRLAAVLAADIVGFSALMEADELGTLTAMTAFRKQAVDPALARHGGRVVKLMGDGMLVEFASVVEAVACARAIQSAAIDSAAAIVGDRRLEYRIGVHLGDVIATADDIFGDGVNVAARLQTLSEPGRVCVSQQVVDQIGTKLDVGFDDLGEPELKNISRPIRVYQLIDGAASGAKRTRKMASVLDRPAVAVLPFENMSREPDQEYFSDGLAEDIITALSLVRSFPVIARNSSFGFKGNGTDVGEIAGALGAQYLVQGSVRRAGKRVRVSVQLIDARTRHQCWAERVDRALDDIFALQDEITEKIVATLVPELEQAELKRASTRRPGSLGAWDWYARGSTEVNRFTLDGNAAARGHFAKALELDPDYADAWTGLGFAHLRDLNLEGDRPREECIREGLAAARRAVAADANSSQAHLCLGTAYVWMERWELAMAETELAIRLNPSNAHARMALGNRLDLVGRTAEGIEHLERGIQLNPRDLRIRIFMRYLARAYLNAKDYVKAEEWIRKALHHDPEWPLALYMLASIQGHMGRLDEAAATLDACERLAPGFVAKHSDWRPYADAAANRHFHAGAERARKSTSKVRPPA